MDTALPDLVETCNNLDHLALFAAELTYKHELFGVVILGDDERGDEFNRHWTYFVDLLKRRVVGSFRRFKGIGTPFSDTIWDRSVLFGRVLIARDDGSTHRQVSANGVHATVPFWALCTRLSILWN